MARAFFLFSLALIPFTVFSGWIAAIAVNDPTGWNIRPALKVFVAVGRTLQEALTDPLPEDEREPVTKIAGDALDSLDAAATGQALDDFERKLDGSDTSIDDGEGEEGSENRASQTADDFRAAGCPPESLTGVIPSYLSAAKASEAKDDWESGTLRLADRIQVQQRFGEPQCIIGSSRWVYWVTDGLGVLTVKNSNGAFVLEFTNVE